MQAPPSSPFSLERGDRGAAARAAARGRRQRGSPSATSSTLFNRQPPPHRFPFYRTIYMLIRLHSTRALFLAFGEWVVCVIARQPTPHTKVVWHLHSPSRFPFTFKLSHCSATGSAQQRAATPPLQVLTLTQPKENETVAGGVRKSRHNKIKKAARAEKNYQN